MPILTNRNRLPLPSHVSSPNIVPGFESTGEGGYSRRNKKYPKGNMRRKKRGTRRGNKRHSKRRHSRRK